MRKYWAIFRIVINDAFVQRAEGFVYFLADLMTPLLMMIAWQAIFINNNQIGGYSLSQILIYYLFIFVLRTILSVYPNEITRYIKTGELNFFLVKPMGLIAYQLIGEFAWKVVRLIFLLISTLIMYKLFLSGSTLPPLYLYSPAFIISLILAFLLNFFLKVCIEFFAFWISETEGLRISFYILEAFFAGALLPINLMPKIIQELGNYLPFKYFYYFPTQIALGNLSVSEISSGLFVVSLWLFGAYMISRLFLNFGLKHYSAYSG